MYSLSFTGFFFINTELVVSRKPDPLPTVTATGLGTYNTTTYSAAPQKGCSIITFQQACGIQCDVNITSGGWKRCSTSLKLVKLFFVGDL